MPRALLVIIAYMVGAGSSVAQAHPSESSPTFTDYHADVAFSSRDYGYCPRAAVNEIQLGQCLRMQAEYAERQLNETYKKVMARITAAEKNALRQEERSWIRRREAECTRQAEDARTCVNGCGVPPIAHLICMTKEANNRVQELDANWNR
jgi:uncharacterized protein YecT (DUF1311 family)